VQQPPAQHRTGRHRSREVACESRLVGLIAVAVIT
jgi:hypothetical protein